MCEERDPVGNNKGWVISSTSLYPSQTSSPKGKFPISFLYPASIPLLIFLSLINCVQLLIPMESSTRDIPSVSPKLFSHTAFRSHWLGRYIWGKEGTPRDDSREGSRQEHEGRFLFISLPSQVLLHFKDFRKLVNHQHLIICSLLHQALVAVLSLTTLLLIQDTAL